MLAVLSFPDLKVTRACLPTTDVLLVRPLKPAASPPLQLVASVSRTVSLASTPYVHSFLSFREAHFFVELVEELRTSRPDLPTPQLIFVDGNGRWHPRQAGSAVATGVATELPTVGIGACSGEGEAGVSRADDATDSQGVPPAAHPCRGRESSAVQHLRRRPSALSARVHDLAARDAGRMSSAPAAARRLDRPLTSLFIRALGRRASSLLPSPSVPERPASNPAARDPPYRPSSPPHRATPRTPSLSAQATASRSRRACASPSRARGRARSPSRCASPTGSVRPFRLAPDWAETGLTDASWAGAGREEARRLWPKG